MDPVTLILGALAVGASDVTATAVKDAYAALKRLVSDRFADRRAARTALEEHERDPDTWHVPVRRALEASGAATDAQIVEAAQRVMTLLDPDGARAGRFVVNVTGGQGVQIGDHNVQHNTFGA